MKKLSFDGQAMRMLRYLREHPGATSLDITRALFVVNVTGRVSDLRAAGFDVRCRKRPDGYDGYIVVEPKPADTGEQTAMSL